MGGPRLHVFRVAEVERLLHLQVDRNRSTGIAAIEEVGEPRIGGEEEALACTILERGELVVGAMEAHLRGTVLVHEFRLTEPVLELG